MHKLIGLFALIAACNAAIKMPITVFYESLCPDSAAFITNQLYPAVKNDFKNLVDITWVPYGKSTHSTRGSEVEFTCHHGPNECYGNKVHSCALQHIQANSYETEHTRESLILDFVTCLMRAGKNFPDNKYPGEKCARENHINNWEVIATCANSTEGNQLLKKNGELTQVFQNPLESVPSVVFNHQFEKSVQDKALMDFRGTFCLKSSEPKPFVCKTNSAGKFVISPLLIAVFTYIATKLG